jgi:hypothetical protein
MKSVALNKFHANSFLLIKTQEKLPWFSLHHVIRQVFCSSSDGNARQKKIILGASRQHCTSEEQTAIFLQDESILFQDFFVRLAEPKLTQEDTNCYCFIEASELYGAPPLPIAKKDTIQHEPPRKRFQ